MVFELWCRVWHFWQRLEHSRSSSSRFLSALQQNRAQSRLLYLLNTTQENVLLLLRSNHEQGLKAKRINLWSILWSSKWFSIQPSRSARDQSRRLKGNLQSARTTILTTEQLNEWAENTKENQEKSWQRKRRLTQCISLEGFFNFNAENANSVVRIQIGRSIFSL